MKKPEYPETPSRNCAYCKDYNSKANACSSAKSAQIAVFNPITDADCPILRYDKKENPEINTPAFVQEFCKGTKCPFYFEKLNLCTRPSKCPFKTQSNPFQNLSFDNDI